MRQLCLSLIALLALAACTADTNGSSAVLDPAQGPTLLLQQRATPERVEGFWRVDEKTAQDIDRNIARVGALGNAHGMHVKDPANTLRQYMGIRIDGKPLVYVNAFPTYMDESNWQAEAVQTADGGTLIWGAVYDPATGRFEQLSTNACFGGCE